MSQTANEPGFDGYTVLQKLGQGGMGVVYKVQNLKLDRIEALKIISPTFSQHTQLMRRFELEAKALARIHHPNIVTIYALQESPAGQYITMEYVEGQTLGKKILTEGFFNWKSSVNIVEQLLTAFGYAHKEGVLHRDIKPNNIMLTTTGQVKVMDFGLAKLYLSQDITQTTHQAGTLAYMSPEQIKGEKLDQRSDIFAIGMTLYEMYSGRLPFDRDLSQFRIQQFIVEEEFSPPKNFNQSIPKDLSRLIMKALQKAPEDRYNSAIEMLEAFKAFCLTAELQQEITSTKVYTRPDRKHAGDRKANKEVVQDTKMPVGSINEPVSTEKTPRQYRLVLAALFLISGTVWASISLGPSILQKFDSRAIVEQTPKSNEGATVNQHNLPVVTSQQMEEPLAQDPTLEAGEEYSTQDPGELLTQTEFSSQLQEANQSTDSEADIPQQSARDEQIKSKESTSFVQPVDQDSLLPAQLSNTSVALERENRPDSSSLAIAEQTDSSEAGEGQKPDVSEPAPEISIEDGVRMKIEQLVPQLREAIVSGDWGEIPKPVANYYRDNINTLKKNFNVLAATFQINNNSSLFLEKRCEVFLTTSIEYQQKGRDDRLSMSIPSLWIWTKENGETLLEDVREK